MKKCHEKVLKSYYGKEKDLIEAVIQSCPKNVKTNIKSTCFHSPQSTAMFTILTNMEEQTTPYLTVE